MDPQVKARLMAMRMARSSSGSGSASSSLFIGLGAFVVVAIVVVVILVSQGVLFSKEAAPAPTASESSTTTPPPSSPDPSTQSTPLPPPPPPPPPAPITGKNIRYISITARRPEYLNIAEVQAFDEAGNLIRGTPHIHPQYLHFGPELYTDNNVNTFAHTTNVTNAYFHFDLGFDRMVHRVKIENRRDCCKDRIELAQVSMRNTADQEFCAHTIREVKDTYEFDLTQTPCSMRVS
jgi:hypothetical protein